MNQEQAERRAERFNRMPRHKMISYMAHPMEPTKWEKNRWGVVQCVGDKPYPLSICGIAAT